MAKLTNRLSARSVSALHTPGMHADGDGLYLVIDKSGAKRWSFVYHRRNRRREMGLGSARTVSLADARDAAAEQRILLHDDQDPLEVRRSARIAHAAEDFTFGAFADKLIEDLSSQFRNEKHIAQWKMTLREYAAPLRSKRLAEIDTEDVLGVLKPIWQTKAETASRLRGRIERVLDAAKAKGLRSGENPARWRGHLDTLLPKRRKLTRGHHAAMPYVDLPVFMTRLRASKSVGSSALEFLVLTSARTNEVVRAVWEEIDLEERVWTIPAERMKAARQHRVPLSDRAIDVLERMHQLRESGFVFPGQRRDRPISAASISKALRMAGGGDYTVHGFRSSFRDWVGEETDFSENVAEAALAHVIGDATTRAYRRGDALAKRRVMMDAWAHYCIPTS